VGDNELVLVAESRSFEGELKWRLTSESRLSEINTTNQISKETEILTSFFL
jgi:hypothetical protein